MPAAVGAPGLLGGGGGGVGHGRVLGEMCRARVLDLGRVDHVLAVVGELDVCGWAVPFAVAAGVATGVAAVRGPFDGERGGHVARVAERRAVVCVRVRCQVRGLQVRHLGRVNHAAVVRQRGGAVLDETCANKG